MNYKMKAAGYILGLTLLGQGNVFAKAYAERKVEKGNCGATCSFFGHHEDTWYLTNAEIAENRADWNQDRLYSADQSIKAAALQLNSIKASKVLIPNAAKLIETIEEYLKLANTNIDSVIMLKNNGSDNYEPALDSLLKVVSELGVEVHNFHQTSVDLMESSKQLQKSGNTLVVGNAEASKKRAQIQKLEDQLVDAKNLYAKSVRYLTTAQNNIEVLQEKNQLLQSKHESVESSKQKIASLADVNLQSKAILEAESDSQKEIITQIEAALKFPFLEGFELAEKCVLNISSERSSEVANALKGSECGEGKEVLSKLKTNLAPQIEIRTSALQDKIDELSGNSDVVESELSLDEKLAAAMLKSLDQTISDATEVETQIAKLQKAKELVEKMGAEQIAGIEVLIDLIETTEDAFENGNQREIEAEAAERKARQEELAGVAAKNSLIQARIADFAANINASQEKLQSLDSGAVKIEKQEIKGSVIIIEGLKEDVIDGTSLVAKNLDRVNDLQAQLDALKGVEKDEN